MPRTDAGTGRGNRGPRAPRQPRRDLAPVPSRSQVTPGRQVSIVLKADQGTGRQVGGVVADVLTAGDHPRGIKVRLADGRVGRVQAMLHGDPVAEITESSASAAAGVNGPSRLVQTSGADQVQHRGATESFQKLKYRDVRLDDQPAEPETEYDLFSFVKVKGKKGKRFNSQGPFESGDVDTADLAALNITAPVEAQDRDSLNKDTDVGVIANCPVCGDFEGDEMAVSHHIEQDHFG